MGVAGVGPRESHSTRQIVVTTTFQSLRPFKKIKRGKSSPMHVTCARSVPWEMGVSYVKWSVECL